VYTYSLGRNTVGGNGACIASPTNYFSSAATLSNTVKIYTNTGLSSPASNAYYSDGTNFWRITDGNGTLSSQAPCP
jgi:hypothetical protein